jgi:carbonic anhydrase
MSEHIDRASCNCSTEHLVNPMRRHVLFAGATLSVGALHGCSVSNIVDPVKTTALTKERRDGLSPDDLIKLAKEGNERFRKGEQRPRDFLSEQQISAQGQYPAAVLLTCIDSRAPAEILLDLGIGDVFNSRVAGNIVNEDILGSMEFACELSGAKLVVVMGHTSCGAIKGAINNVTLGSLTSLLAKIKPAVEATVYEGDRTSNNYAFVDAVARTNIEFTIRDIRIHSTVLSALEKTGKIKIVGAMYNISNGAIDIYDWTL